MRPDRLLVAAVLIVASAACTVTVSPSGSPHYDATAPAVTPSPQPTPRRPVGDTWLSVPDVPEPDAQILAVTAGGPGWVAVGSACPVPPGDCESRMPAAWSSPDGSAWTRAAGVPAADAGEMTAVAWDGSLLYAAGTTDLTHGAVWRSADARAWELVEDGAVFDLGSCYEGCPGLERIAAGPGGVIVTGVRIEVRGTRVDVVPSLWSSADGGAWEVGEGLTPGPDADADTVARIADVVAAGPGFVAIGQVCDPRCRATTWTSSDGRDWTAPADLPGGREAMPLRMVASGSRFAAIAERCPADDECTSVTTWSSADGRTWSDAPLEAAPGYPVRGLLAASRGRFIVLGSLGARITVWTSSDGATWEQRPAAGLPGLGPNGGVLALDLAGGPLGALLVGEQETGDPKGVTTSAWVSSGD